MKESHYNIHGIITVKIKTQHQELIDECDHHLRNFKIPPGAANAHLMITDLDRFILPNESFNISNSLYGFANGFYNKREQYALKLQGGYMMLYVKENNLSLTALIEHLLLPFGYTFIHGAGISFKNQGVIFPAPPNTGKTLLMSALTQMKEMKFFGDDYVIVKNTKEMFSYPMDFSIYKYHFNFFNELKSGKEAQKIKKDFFERIVVNLIKNTPIKKYAKRVARLLRYDYLRGGEFLKVPASRLVPKETFGTSVPLKYVVVLNQYEGAEFKIEKITPAKASDEVVGTLFSEWRETMPFFYAAGAFGLIDFSQYAQVMKNVAQDAFLDLAVFRMLIPKNITIERRLEGMKNILEKELFSAI